MKTLMMIRRMKEVLTWVWIAVIGTAICLNEDSIFFKLLNSIFLYIFTFLLFQ